MAISKKAIGIFSIAAIVAFLALSATASAAVINVPGDYPTIQEAINAVDATNRTIEVDATTYNEKETISVNESDIVIRSINGRAVVSAGGADDHVVNITDQTNVTLQGFEIRDANGTTQDVAGIYMENATYCTISNNTVTNISATGVDAYAYGILLYYYSSNNTFNSSTSVSNVTATDTYGDAYGIWLETSSSNTFSSSTSVSDVTARDEAYGIVLRHESKNNTFSSSTSVSNITGYDAYGIYLEGSCNNNTFSSSTSVSTITATSWTYGIYLYRKCNNNTFNSSTSVSNVNGGDIYGISLLGSSHNSFNSNTSVSNVNATGWACGIYLQPLKFQPCDYNTFSSSTSVSNITATGGVCGIYLHGSSNNRFNSSTSISNLTATNWDAYGILLRPTTIYGDPQLYVSSNNTFCPSTSISNVTSTTRTAYGICIKSDSNNDNNVTVVTIAPTLTGAEYYEFWSDENCDGNVVTDMTIGNPTTISFTYGNGIWIKRVNVSERPGDPGNYRNISKYINASNLTANSWLLVNFSYNESDVYDAGLTEGTLKVWKHNGTAWNEDGWNGSRVLDTVNNVVGVNITRFCIFAPLVYIPTSLTIPTATGTGTATITTSPGYFCDLAAVNEAELSSLPDSPVTFFHGFFNITICGLNTSTAENVTINFTFPSAIPTNAELWKYNASNGTWYRYDFGDNDGDNVISITITDNGPGDHNPALGVIEDPNGIGWLPPAVAPLPAVTPLGLVVLVSMLSIIAALTISTRRKRR